MFTRTGTTAPHFVADSFVRGAGRHSVILSGYRGTWVVLAFGVTRLDVLELAELEEVFAADGAIVLAATTDDWDDVASSYANEPVRFPILAGVAETRRITAIIDPTGFVRHVGRDRTAHETLASLEAQLVLNRLAA